VRNYSSIELRDVYKILITRFEKKRKKVFLGARFESTRNPVNKQIQRIIIVTHHFINTFFVRFRKLLGGFLWNFYLWAANFVLKNSLNFKFLENKFELVTNCFSNTNHKNEKFPTLNDSSIKLWIMIFEIFKSRIVTYTVYLELNFQNFFVA